MEAPTTEHKGKIIKGIGGFYTVLTDEGALFVCKARGLFRKKGETPLPGDNVEFSVDSKGDGYLLNILPRANMLTRPSVANVDMLLIVVAATEPQADLELVDKLLLYCAKLSIASVIVVNKCDNGVNAACNDIMHQYHAAKSRIIPCSSSTGYGMGELGGILTGRTICLAGQSAVGKTSLLNRLLGLSLAVGELSQKTERGKHTTRHAELLQLAGGGLIADTPGFSLLDSIPLEPEEIPRLYPEFLQYIRDCRFNSCVHISEPGCAVKAAVEVGSIAKERYTRYLKITSEAIDLRRHRYD